MHVDPVVTINGGVTIQTNDSASPSSASARGLLPTEFSLSAAAGQPARQLVLQVSLWPVHSQMPQYEGEYLPAQACS